MSIDNNPKQNLDGKSGGCMLNSSSTEVIIRDGAAFFARIQRAGEIATGMVKTIHQAPDEFKNEFSACVMSMAAGETVALSRFNENIRTSAKAFLAYESGAIESKEK